MSGLFNKAVVDKEQELRPVRFTETGRMGLGKILKAARQTTGWSVSETEFKTKGYEEALFTKKRARSPGLPTWFGKRLRLQSPWNDRNWSRNDMISAAIKNNHLRVETF